jgi:ATP-dependent DNA helicase RecG
MTRLRAGKEISRRYRNRRIVEFLKGIDLSEKQSTGITKILNALRRNGSPAPDFETDAERNHMITTLYIHEGFRLDEVTGRRKIVVNGNTNADKILTENLSESLTESLTEVLSEKEWEVLRLIRKNRAVSSAEMALQIGVTRQTISNRIRKLKEKNIIQRRGSDTKGYWEIVRGPFD